MLGDPAVPRPPQKVAVNKLVRTDALNPAGRIHAFLETKRISPVEDENDLAFTRRLVRLRRNPRESADLTSVQDLLAVVDQDTHSELKEILQNCIYVGMADATLALVQYKTCLYLLNVVNLSKELMYQQVLRRFAHFQTYHLTNPAGLKDVFIMGLNAEELVGNWDETDGPKDQIAKMNAELLLCKSEMLREYFSVDIDKEGNLNGLPIVLDQYKPDMDRLAGFVLNIGNNVNWEEEKECFETFAAALADFYAMHPPLLPDPSDEEGRKFYHLSKPGNDNGASAQDASSEVQAVDEELISEAQTIWAQRDWTIQHVLFPAMKLFLNPPRHMAKDGSVIKVAYLENLFKIFERC